LEENKSFNFSPNLSISKNLILKTDDRFYKSEIKHLESNIKRRKDTLFKLENKKDYDNKIFYLNKSNKNFNKKITYPKEFNFNVSKSRKSLMVNNKANFLHKAENVQDIRKMLNTCNFFNDKIIEIYEINDNHNFNYNYIDKGNYIENNIDVDVDIDVDKSVKGINKKRIKSIRDTDNVHIENNRKLINLNIKKINNLQKKITKNTKNYL